MHHRILFTAASLLALAAAACASGGEVTRSLTPPVPAPEIAPSPAAAQARPAGRPPRPSTLTPDETVAFCEPIDGVELLMDVYYPDGHTSASETPAVVYVHGGGWTSGSRTTGEGSRYIPSLVEQGFVVFAVDYRLSPAYAFPAHIQDVQCAIRHIRANASVYGVHPDRIGAIGGSAGGQLVNLLGTAEDGDFPPAGGYADYSSDVSVVVSLYGASDFGDPNMASHNANNARVFGASVYEDNEENALWVASAVNYIDPGDASFLLLHGEEDPVVPISQSERFEAVLEEAGIDVTFIRVANAGHAFSPSGGSPDPSPAQLITTAVHFFEDRL